MISIMMMITIIIIIIIINIITVVIITFASVYYDIRIKLILKIAS